MQSTIIGVSGPSGSGKSLFSKKISEDLSNNQNTIIILNQKIRPFTAKWHKKSLNGAFENPKECKG